MRNLKPVPDGQVYGEAEYSYHTASNINGQTLEDAGGHKVINNNGKVREFNFTPDTDQFVSLLFIFICLYDLVEAKAEIAPIISQQ